MTLRISGLRRRLVSYFSFQTKQDEDVGEDEIRGEDEKKDKKYFRSTMD